ncbi:MAG: hypothetical protein QNM01_05480 [Actinomycetes bacterium]
MPAAPTTPIAVIMALWLNAARSELVSATDAANACETLADQMGYELASEPIHPTMYPILDLVSAAMKSAVPVTVALPVFGDPAGVPANVLAQIDPGSGVVAINANLLLAQTPTGDWLIFETPHNIAFQDLNHARRQLNESISLATEFLASAQLIGDSTEVEEELRNFRLLHLPPSLASRNVAALELAARIRIVANNAVQTSMAIASPSTDRKRIEMLQTLDRQARELLQAIALG